jgi:hypothetical protein
MPNNNATNLFWIDTIVATKWFRDTYGAIIFWLTLYTATNTGEKMKETGTTQWDSPNTGVTNESGFSALLAGLRFYDGDINGMVFY